MNELNPLTISSSVRKYPTVLFTRDRSRYLMYAPINETNHIISELYCFIHDHFKVEQFKKGSFSYQGKRYLCHEDIPGRLKFDDWMSFQWKKKRQFNRFIRPRTLFDIFLVDLYFPVFKQPSIWVVPGVKDRFVVHPFEGGDRLRFEPGTVNNTGLSTPSVRSFFKHVKHELFEYVEDFQALHHDKLRADLKYRISLYPEHRNEFWNELQLCYDASFQKFVTADITNYIMQL